MSISSTNPLKPLGKSAPTAHGLPIGRGVYVIMTVGHPAMKVGFTRSVRARLASLESSSPFDLELIAWLPGGTPDDEAELHCLLHDFHIRGEWFRAEQPALQVVDERIGRRAPARREIRYKRSGLYAANEYNEAEQARLAALVGDDDGE